MTFDIRLQNCINKHYYICKKSIELLTLVKRVVRVDKKN